MAIKRAISSTPLSFADQARSVCPRLGDRWSNRKMAGEHTYLDQEEVSLRLLDLLHKAETPQRLLQPCSPLCRHQQQKSPQSGANMFTIARNQQSKKGGTTRKKNRGTNRQPRALLTYLLFRRASLAGAFLIYTLVTLQERKGRNRVGASDDAGVARGRLHTTVPTINGAADYRYPPRPFQSYCCQQIIPRCLPSEVKRGLQWRGTGVERRKSTTNR